MSDAKAIMDAVEAARAMGGKAGRQVTAPLLAAALAADSAIVFVSTASEMECVPCRVPIPWSFMDKPNAKIRFRIDPCGCAHYGTRWTFVTRDGAVYTLSDSTGAKPRRLGSLWGPR